MQEYKLELSDIERACGVTLEDVARELPRVLMRDGRCITRDIAPALAGAVARAALGGPAQFAGLNALGLPVYTLS